MSNKAVITAVTNQKGGTGKTTTCENLGIGLAMEGKKVLLVDCDPQASLTIALGNPRPDDLPITLSDLMAKVISDQPISHGEGILHHPEGVDLVPANIALAGTEVSLVTTMSRETILKQYLDTVRKDYDFILLDCMPSLGMLTVNALAAAEQALIPVQANYLSAKGLEQLLNTINKVRRQINPKLRIEGILLTMVDSRTNDAKEISQLIRDTYGGKLKVYGTDIPRSVRAAEISAEGKSIFAHDPNGKVADAYRTLTKEVMKNAEKRRQNHPFKVVDDEAMLRTTESIAQFGVLTPLIARPLEEGGYEIISGHRRVHAAEAAGLTDVPVIVRDMTDDEAVVLMVDSNLQRENILPSERAFAYKMKMEAMKRQGERTDLQEGGTSCQVGTKFRTDEIIAESLNESARNIQRYIRLTNLIPELLDMLDQKLISFNPAVELSYLTPDEQKNLLEAMDYTQAAPSLSQAQRLKKLSQEGGCALEDMCEILGEVKKGDLERVAFKSEQLRKYFPKSYSPKQMQDTIIKLLEQWQKKRQRGMEL